MGISLQLDAYRESPIRAFLRDCFEAPGSGERILPIEGLRGLAVLLVSVVHFGALFRPYFRPGSALAIIFDTAMSLGEVAVDVFFVLSGFFIYGILIEKNPDYWTFVWRRARRLYPVFLVVLCLYLVLSFLLPGESKLPPLNRGGLLYLGANLLLLPGMMRITPIITVAWSLSYEWFFYLALPLLIAVLRLRHWSRWQRVRFFLVLPLAYYLLSVLGLANDIQLVFFSAGIIIWELKAQNLPERLNPWTEYVVAAALLINILAITLAGDKGPNLSTLLPRAPNFYAPSLFATLLPFCLYAMFVNGFLKRLFSWVYLRWMGNISYSYYLIHGLALHGMKLLVNWGFTPAPRPVFFDILLFVASLSFATFCAAIFYLLVEKPLSVSRTAKRRRTEVVGRPVLQAKDTPAYEV
jgi:peptidoglycan/LPS O-acetylase OafA/YrhL